MYRCLLCFRSEGKATIQKTVPDTITSWVISGFSVDPLFGLGLSESPRKVWDEINSFVYDFENIYFRVRFQVLTAASMMFRVVGWGVMTW
jgi:CD109 antigen